MDAALLILIFLVGVALTFDFLNGMHDAANSIATIVSTRALSPRWAVVFAAVCNFIAFWLVGLKVADTVGKGIVDPAIVDNAVIFGALMGAIFWNVVTWLAGIPSSSSHALVGGFLGAGITKAGSAAIIMAGVKKTLFGIVLAPTLGFAIALVLMLIFTWLFVKATPRLADRVARWTHYITAGLYSVGHGGNDAQKTMGIIAVLLLYNGKSPGGFHVPLWVVLACYATISAGTLLGGWRIVHTMGSKITKLSSQQGLCASGAGAITLFLATHYGVPVSTTHTITGAIMGVGSAKRVSAVRWGVAKNIVLAWFITMPAAGLVGALFYFIGSLFLK